MKEKTSVKQEMQYPLVLDEVWQPIATAWFDKWKAYVNYDAVTDVKCVKGCHPGPVDNSSLKGSFGLEMRRDLEAELDYVLLPEETADWLLKRFGGGPAFSRNVILADDSDDGTMEVDLWPVFVYTYICDRSHPTPEPHALYMQTHYYVGRMKLQEVINDEEQSWFHSDKTTTPTRYWLRGTPPNPEAADTGIRRRLTNDRVEWDGDWHLIKSAAMGRRIKDIRGGDRDFVKLIIEVAPCRDPKPSDWPRFHLLEAWKQGIHKDDMIDARDVQGHVTYSGTRG